jgi:hypothetical protein
MLHAHFATSGGKLRTAYYGDEELRAGLHPGGEEEPLAESDTDIKRKKDLLYALVGPGERVVLVTL